MASDEGSITTDKVALVTQRKRQEENRSREMIPLGERNLSQLALR